MSDSTSGWGGGNFLGMSPQFAQNLLNFGASTMMAANARTPQGFLAYGGGPLGPIGAGLVGMQQQNMDLAKLRGQLGLQQAETQEAQARAAMLGPQADFFRAQANVLNDPNAFNPGGGGGFGQLGSPYGGLTGNANSIRAPANVIPPEQREQMVRGAVKGTDVPANVLDALTAHESNWDANAKGGKGEIGLTQTMPDTAHNPGYGVPGVDINALTLPQNSLKFAAQYLQGIANSYGMKPEDWSNPTKLAQVLHDYNGQQAPASYAQDIIGRMRQAPSWAPKPYQIAQAGGGAPPMPGQAPAPLQMNMQPQMSTLGGQVPLSFNGMNPQEMQQRADALSAQAARLNFIKPGSGAGLEKAADQLRGLVSKQQELQMGIPAAGATEDARQRAIEAHAGEIARQKALNENFSARPGSGGIIQTPNGPMPFKFPELKTEITPEGTAAYTHIAPPPLGSPEGTAGTSTPVVNTQTGKPVAEKLPSQITDARNHAYTEYSGKEGEAYTGSQNTQAWLEQMDHAAQVLNDQGGFMGTGPTAPGRLKFASKVNDLLRSTGLPTAFDPKAIGYWEELKKATTTAGFELSSHYEGHSRQAAQTIQNATSAVPAEANSPIGFHIVSAGIREAAQQNIDLYNYKRSVYNDPDALVNADADFYARNSPQMYTQRAISSVEPRPVQSDADLQNYLPGTFVSYKGKVVQVPQRPGAPPIPAYLKRYAPQPMQQQAE